MNADGGDVEEDAGEGLHKNSFMQSEEEEEDQHVRGSPCLFYSEATVMTWYW